MTLGFFSNDNSLNFKLYQMDVKSAFLNRVLRDEVCIKQAWVLKILASIPFLLIKNALYSEKKRLIRLTKSPMERKGWEEGGGWIELGVKNFRKR